MIKRLYLQGEYGFPLRNSLSWLAGCQKVRSGLGVVEKMGGADAENKLLSSAIALW
jgi:hypothetical protein